MKNLLITGRPGSGKTTLIRKLAGELKALHPVGFFTAEIREEGTRKGFELVSLDGRKGLFSHEKIRSPHRVGKYGVDLEGFESFLQAIPFLAPSTRLIIIDEIGKMECLSARFRKLLLETLDSDKLLIATIALKGTSFIEEIKRREDIKILEITQQNANLLLTQMISAAKDSVIGPNLKR